MDIQLITVQQLPIIKTNLEAKKQEILERTRIAQDLICTEKSKADVKQLRADFNKEFKEFENCRKEVKAKVMNPYEEFNALYKECVEKPYKDADDALRFKISSIEDEEKKKIDQDARSYFSEVNPLDFLRYEDLNLHINLNTKFKSEVDAMLKKIVGEVSIIKMSDNSEEVLFEYKKTFNLESSIRAVKERKEALKSTSVPTVEIKEKAQFEFEEDSVTIALKLKGTSEQIDDLKNYIKIVGIEIL